MAVNTYIITPTDFVGRADISQNLDTGKLQTIIGAVQEIFMNRLLCEEFYNEVLAVVAGTATDAAITTLLPYIRDYLVHKVYEDYIATASALVTPAGVRVQADNVADVAAPDVVINSVMNRAHRNADFFQDRLINFLKINEDDYPTWRDSICGCGRRVENANRFTQIAGRGKRQNIEWT